MNNLRVLHCHSTFSPGGKEARAVRLMNAFGQRARHVVLSAVPGAFGARDGIDPDVRVEFPENAPSLEGKPTLARYRALGAFMRGFDLVLTYNWGAMDAVMARRMFARELPPLVHHEDGFNADESVQLKTKRNLFRRLGLPAAHALVVPSRTLETVARDIWKQPDNRVRRIANGVNTGLYAARPTVSIPGLRRKKGEVVIGTLAGLRAVKNLPRLVRAVAAVPAARLVIVGEGPERGAIEAEAQRCGLGERVTLTGFMPAPHRFIGYFDIFALSSDTEQFPISVLEAMAAGLPVLSTRVGDVPDIVSAENAEYVVDAGDEMAYRAALARLVADGAERARIGNANRVKARAVFDEKGMIDAYRTLYEQAVGWRGALGES